MENNNNNNIFSKSELSTDRLKELYDSLMKDSSIPDAFKNPSYSQERVVSDYLTYLEYGPDPEYSRKLPTISHTFTKDGKQVSIKLKQMTLADYDISYPATGVEIEKDGELTTQTVIGDNILFENQLLKLIQYARLAHGEEAFNHLMEHAADCAEHLHHAPADADFDSIHRSNGNKFRKLFKKDALVKQVKRELKRLDRENTHYRVEKRHLDVANDAKKSTFDESLAVENQPVAQKIVPFVPSKSTEKERDE